MSRKGKTDFVSLIQAARAGQPSTSEVEGLRTTEPGNFSTSEVEKLRSSQVHSSESSVVDNLRTKEVEKFLGSELEDLSTREAEKPASLEAENFSTSELDNPSSLHFSQLESKTVRFRDEQLERVAQVAKRLRRAQKLKARESGRITDNTLIRVAVDFMLAYARGLQGETEAELLESLHRQAEEGRIMPP